MLLNNFKKSCFILLFAVFSMSVFAATTDLAVRFLDKAEEALDEDNIEDAYKYVNQALAVAKDESSQANVLFFAQTVYTQKLQRIQEHYDEMSLAMKDQAAAIKEQAEASKQSQKELKEALDSNFQQIGNAFTESAKETKRSTRVIAFSVIGIAFIIFIIVLLIVVIVRKGFKQQQVQQEQYVQAFKMV